MKQMKKINGSALHNIIQEAVNKALNEELAESRDRHIDRIISETINRHLNEAADPVSKIQSLIAQANDAFRKAAEAQDGDVYPLMDKKGNVYGLTSYIKLDGRGNIIIPIDGGAYSEYQPTKIKVLQKAGGKVRIFPGDFYDEGWKDAAKILKNIIRDSEIAIGYNKEYDMRWEDAETPEDRKANKEALKTMNKKIGRVSSAGMDYLQ